jgi:hypothetical protein
VGVTRWLARRRRRRKGRRRAVRALPAPPLRALTAAALALPGLTHSRVGAAAGDDLRFDYGRYQEGERDLHGIQSDYDPIQVDSLIAGGRITLRDRLRFGFEYFQDTWSGATPIATGPLLLGGNRPTAPDGISGATPFIQGDLFFDSRFDPVQVDAEGEIVSVDDRLVHTLSSASPETRHQGDFELGYEWDTAEIQLGGGLSSEPDFQAGFVRLGGGVDLDEKRTHLGAGLSYTHGDTDAVLDHDAVPYIDTSGFTDQIEVRQGSGDVVLEGTRNDWGVQLGASRVLTRNAVVELDLGFLRSTGYLANPYKVMEVAFIDPEQQFLAPPGGYYGQVRALLEKLPRARNQLSLGARLAHYVEAADASLQLGYGFHYDDWGILAHSFEASWGQPLPFGFLLTPRIRYYTQSAADFYAPYLISQQAYLRVVSDPDTGEIISITPFDHSLLPKHYSSDQRFSGFGALGGGISVSKQLAPGVSLRSDFEYYTHQGSLKLGGGGEGSYSDFDFYTVSAGIRVDSSALHTLGLFRQANGSEHPGHGRALPPAGVMLGHLLPEGRTMIGFRYAFSRQAGDMRHGTHDASDAAIASHGCDGIPCLSAPEEMDMNMFMLDLAFAPTSWLNLMLMPQFVDMRMDLRSLAGAPPDLHGTHPHTSGGVGDLQSFALLRLFEGERHRAHFGLGISAPTGRVDLKLRRTHQVDRGLTHYGMQLGSGTWDLLPSLTYGGGLGRWSWGAQASGVARLGSANSSGYALGDVFQSTLWGGFDVTRWLSLSARALYTWQGEITGQYGGLHSQSGPMDFPTNYGGNFFDLGFGIGLRVPRGALAGNALRVEWLQPVVDDPNGYQLARVGTLFALWSFEF